MPKVGDNVRETKTGLTGRVIRVTATELNDALLLIRLDKEDLLVGGVIGTLSGDVEVLENTDTARG